MKKIACSIAFALSWIGPAQAALFEVAPAPVPRAAVSAASGIAGTLPLAGLAAVNGAPVVAPSAQLSELPEPEVFAMMLLGLILIGYRASRHSDEKFE